MDLMCNRHIDGKACDLAGRSIAAMEKINTNKRKRALKMSESSAPARSLRMGEAPAYGSEMDAYIAEDWDMENSYDPYDSYGSFSGSEEAMEWGIAENMEIMPDHLGMELEYMYLTAMDDVGCTLSLPDMNM